MMSSSINKIQFNNTTRISLNDRFTIMKSVVPTTPPTPVRQERGRSRSRSRTRPAITPRGSMSNCKLVEELDRKHKLRSALKLKNRSLKAGRRQRPTQRIPIKKAVAQMLMPQGRNGNRRLRRANSLSDIATMNADLFQQQRQMKRSNSASNLAGRLGIRSNNNSSPQRGRRLKRSNSLSNNMNRGNLVRSNSRGNLARANSRGNLVRSNSQNRLNRNNGGNLPRANSQNRLNRSGSRQNLNRTRSRSRSRTGRQMNGQMQQIQQQQPLRRRLNRNNFRRANSNQNLPVQSRLGVVKNNRRNLNNSRVAAGKVVKRAQNARVGAGGQKLGGGQRVGRTIKRGRTVAQAGGRQQLGRGRVPNRGNKIRGANNTQQGGGKQGGRRGARGRINNNQGNRGNNRKAAQLKPKSKEDLDKELDQYMANTASDINQYMNGI